MDGPVDETVGEGINIVCLLFLGQLRSSMALYMNETVRLGGLYT